MIYFSHFRSETAYAGSVKAAVNRIAVLCNKQSIKLL